MGAVDFAVDIDAAVILVEWERSLLPEKPTRVVEILPGDRLGVRDLNGYMEVTVDEIGGNRVSFKEGFQVATRELVYKWTGTVLA